MLLLEPFVMPGVVFLSLCALCTTSASSLFLPHKFPDPEQITCAEIFFNDIDTESGLWVPVNAVEILPTSYSRTVPKSVLDTIQNNTLENATFSVAHHGMLQICGFSRYGNPPYSEGTCEHYNSSENWGNISAPYQIYAKKFEYVVTSLSCGFGAQVSECQNQCQIAKDDWKKGNSCALLFLEKKCEFCYFNPIYIGENTKFFSKSTFEVLSTVVRPGCILTKYTNGSRGYRFDKPPHSSQFTGIIEEIQPAFYNDSDICYCHCPEPGQQKNLIFIIIGGCSICVIILLLSVCNYVYKTRRKNEELLNDEDCDILESSDDSNPQLVENKLLQNKEAVDNIIQQVLNALECNHGDQLKKIGYNKLTLDLSPDLIQRFKKICQPDNVLSRESFTTQAKLGAGIFGMVYEGILHPESESSKQLVAIKKFVKRKEDEVENVFETFLQEVYTFQIIGNECQNIVRFLGACCSGGSLFLLTELCEGGSLENVLMVLRPKYINESSSERGEYIGNGYFVSNHSSLPLKATCVAIEDAMKFFKWSYQIAFAMNFLGEKLIIHADLAPRNILLTLNEDIKICDFGLSLKCSKSNYARILNSGHFPWSSLAPELILAGNQKQKMSNKITIHVDVWSYGFTLWRIWSLGASLYPGIEEHDIPGCILAGYLHPEPPLLPPEHSDIYDIMVNCWNKIPEERPSFQELCQLFQTKMDIEKV